MEWADFDEHATFDKWLLVIFQTKCQIAYNGEDYFTIPPYSIIFYPPNTLHAYKSCEETFLNSFALFSVEKEYFDKFAFPLGRVFSISKKYADNIIRSFDEISFILNTEMLPEKKARIPDMLDWVLNIINKAYLEATRDTSPQDVALKTFSDIRQKMSEDPVEYTVKKMVSLSGYSSVYFSTKYKQFFGIGPCQDRKRQLVRVIKNYLQTTDFSLEKIAEMCNLQSVPYLINLFKEEEKITPHQYRRNYQNKTE